MRGSFTVFHDFTAIAPLTACGYVLTPADLLIARRNSSATAIVDPWNAPLVHAASANLATASTAMQACQNGAITAASADAIPGPRSITFNGTVYAISYDSAGAVATDSGSSYHMRPLSLMTVPLNAIPTPTVVANTPKGAFDLIGYQSRIWLLGGIDTPGGLTSHEPCTLFFSNPLTALTGATADWKDPVAGTTNKITMDGDVTDFGVGLAKVRNGLVILRRSSVWLLRGSTTQNYALTPISQEHGCVDARSIVETDVGVYFMSRAGLMLTNGTTVVNVSGSIMRTLQTAIQAEQDYVQALSSGWISCALTTLGQIVVSIGVISASFPSNNSPIFTAMYDPGAAKGGAWVRITSQLWASDGRQVGTNYYAGQLVSNPSYSLMYAIGDKYITSLEATNRTFLDPYGIGLYDDDPSGTWHSIPAAWKTVIPAVCTASKRTFGHAKRWYLDYLFGSNLGPPNGWTVAPVDGNGNALIDSSGNASENVPPIGTPSATGFVSGVSLVPPTVIQRYNQDFWPEIGEVQWNVTFSAPDQNIEVTQTLAEIYGLGFEFQHSRERR